MRRRPSKAEKPLHWVGSSKRDLLVPYGGHPPSAKPWKGLGPGVSEIVEDDASGTFRAVYTVRFREAIYVLHAFHKKSPSGMRTARRDVELIEERLKAAKRDYEARYGKEAD
jgi:phage-related protein